MQYFKHYTSMRHDTKIKRLISKYGIEGYGLYCLIVESIVESLSTESPVPDLQDTCEDLADFYNGNTAKINEIASFMINQGLLEVDDISTRITCHKVYKFLESSQTRSQKIRDMIKSYKGTSYDTSQAVSRLSQTKVIEEKRKEEEQEENKNRTEENKQVVPYREIIEYFNQVTGQTLRTSNISKVYKDAIKARHNEGFTLDDFKHVVDVKHNEWHKDPKTAVWIRPQTLFGTKFESYLQQKVSQDLYGTSKKEMDELEGVW